MGNSNNTRTSHSTVNEEFVEVDRYNGETKDGKRQGHGYYLYPNGDIYEGQWRKSQKYGRGIYTYKNGPRLEGFFYHDKYIGTEPNEKIRKGMAEEEIQQGLYNVFARDPPRIKAGGGSARRAASVQRYEWIRAKHGISS